MAAPDRRTALYRLVDHQLDGGLVAFVAARRGQLVGWRTIAAEVTEKTGTKVTGTTMSSWFAGRIQIDVQIDVQVPVA